MIEAKRAQKRVKLSELVLPQFREFWLVTKARKHLRYVLKGGRASGKSYVIPFRIVTDIVEYPVSALVLRKVQETVVKSAYQNVVTAIDMMGLTSSFRFVESKLYIEYLPRGNKIYFGGANNPERIKSIKDAKFPVALLWFEEAAEFKNEEEMTTIELSVLREELSGKIESDFPRNNQGAFDYSVFYSYNPPNRRRNWINVKFDENQVPDNTYVHHSTYLGNPHLSQAFITEAESVKELNNRKYRHVFLGEPIGSGVEPFDNLFIKKGCLPDSVVQYFDNIRQGIDYGYGADPTHFVRWHFDKKRMIIYALDEFRGVKASNSTIVKFVKDRGYDQQVTTSDSSEPRTTDTLKKDHKWRRLKPAVKGPDSVRAGLEWLSLEINKIVIDPQRTPEIAREFQNIDYKLDKDGQPTDELEDKDDHSIDSTRYAFERDMLASGLGF